MRLRIGVLLVALVAIVMCLGSASQAQVAKADILVGPTLGVAFPMGTFSDAAGVGSAIGGSGDYLITDDMAIGADLVLNYFGGKTLGGGIKTESNHFYRFSGHVKYFFSPQEATIPFVTGGLGIYRSRLSGSTNLGINLGGGIMLKAGEKMKVAIQALYHDIFSSGSSAQYISVAATLFFRVGGKK